MTARHDRSAESLREVQRHFAEFARDYPELPLYQRICTAMSQDDLAGMLLQAAPGQARPVLFLAALHDLVLRRPDLPAARWFPPRSGGAGDPWPDVRETVVRERAALEETIAHRTTQTNEVNRAVYFAVLLSLACRDLPSRPVGLIELGASSGLLLGLDRFHVQLGEAEAGDQNSSVRCYGEDRSAAPLRELRLPTIAARAGVDLHPVDLRDPEAVRWLEACLWPEVPGRIERLRAAVATLRNDPPHVMRGDMVDGVEPSADIVLGGVPDRHLVVFTSWAVTYIDTDRRERLAEILRGLAQGGRPVTWITAEPPGCVPGLPPLPGDASGPTILGARRWRDGDEVPPEAYGACHPHGAWIQLSAEASDAMSSL